MLVIGSHALRLRNPSCLDRHPADFDFIATMDEVEHFIRLHKDQIKAAYPISEGKKYVVHGLSRPVEFEIAWSGSTAETLIELVMEPWVTCGPPEVEVLGVTAVLPTLNVLYELKLSHRYLKNSPHFLKTMRDIQRMRKCGAVVEHPDWLKLREKETYTYSHPKLDVKKDDFFKGDGVTYTFDHDTIHLAMKHLDKPAYEYYKDPNNEVLCSKKLFFEVDEQIRLYGVLEEAYVLALERSQVPFPSKMTPRKSFEMALMKVASSITSGWFREYAWEHYDQVMALYDDGYVTRFWQAVEAGIVKRLSK